MDEISTRQDGFQAQFLNSRVDNTVVTNSVADEISLQAKQLDRLRGMIADVRAYVTEIADRIYEQELITDDLAQYSRANCLILRGCKDLPAQEATEQDFKNYVLDKLNSKIKLRKALENNDIDICHVLPSTKGKTQSSLNSFVGPFGIKFLHANPIWKLMRIIPKNYRLLKH